MNRRSAVYGHPKCALVTGGTGGIGQAVISELAGIADKIVFTYYRSVDEACRLATMIESAGSVPLPVQVDLRDQNAWKHSLQQILKDHGLVDFVVNSAGISEDALCVETTYESLREQFEVSVFAAWTAMTTIGREMMYHHRGRIVNVASVAATLNSPGRSVYGSTKAAIIALTRSFAKELGRFGILVNAIAPGFVETDMTEHIPTDIRKKYLEQVPLGKFASPKQIAELIKFLASDAADYIHGAVLTVDGGMTA
ncbi:SDR family NAD(P)-dependent oxidoreductase [Alicyclobacillus tolerans]|uniref:SDR family NAD(P)-dependent oxidoreductase n=1 Tax=Alicyclobacillus tolerans TaxID=90970 RepID=UPI003B77A798